MSESASSEKFSFVKAAKIMSMGYKPILAIHMGSATGLFRILIRIYNITLILIYGLWVRILLIGKFGCKIYKLES